jgi:vacuolar-type H+-ATPase subunit E/Vma4
MEDLKMFSKLFTSKLRMELAEIKHKHTLEIKELTAQIELEKRHWTEDRERLIKKLKDEHDLKLKEAVTMVKLDGQQQAKQAQLDADRKLNLEVQKLTEQHYESLKAAMTKLHEEGNVTTKFTQELALKMMQGMPANKSETKVLTGSIDVSG